MLHTITIESINIKAAKEGIGKNNKPYKLYPIGIKSNGEWLNGAAFSDKDVIIFQNLKNGDKIELEVYDEEWNGKTQKKFKLPTKDDRANNELQALKDRVTKLEAVVKSIVSNNKLVYKTEPALAQQKPIVTPMERPGKYENEIMDSDLPF